MVVAHVEEEIQQAQWPFDRAATVTDLPAELLRKLVRDGVLTGKAYWRTGSEVMGWCDINQAREIAAQLAEARRPVEGNGILVTEAAEKYGFHRESIYRWIQSGWIEKYKTAANGDLLLNEGDIALARALADLTGQGSGKPVFPKRRRI